MRKLKAKKGDAADGYRKEAQGREKCGGPDSGKCGGVARREPPDRIELGDGQDLSRYSERHKNERPLFRQPRLPAEGGKTVSNNLNYLNYLEESTNVVKSRRRLGKLVLVAAYLVIWAVSVAFFWLAVSGSDAGAYAVLVIWGAIPLTTFVISLLIGANGYWGRRKWWAVPILALMYTLIPFLTFTLANAASTGVSAGDIAVNLDDLITLPIGAVVSAAGLEIGTGIEKLQKRKLKRKNNILTQESTKSQE